MARIALAVNPTSGRGFGAQAALEAGAFFRAAQHLVVEVTAPDAEGLSSAARKLVTSGGLDALVVIGGDGMVNLGVNVLADSDVPLGIIAAGTGNDIARGLGLPVRSPQAAAQVVDHALTDSVKASSTRRIDVVYVSGQGLDPAHSHRFVGVMGLGIDSLVNERANRMRWPKGPSRYDLALLVELGVFSARNYELDIDGVGWHGRAMMVTVGNGTSYGGGMKILPDADISDGLIDVLILREVSKIELLKVFPRVYKGTHVTHPKVEVHRCRSVTVSAQTMPGRPDSGIVGYGDGERFAPVPLTCTVLPGALQVLVGPTTSSS